MSPPQTIGMGTWALGGDFYGPQSQTQSLRTLEIAWDHGCRHFDTAPVYGRGTAEHLLGRFLKNKSGYTVTTKCFLRSLQAFSSSFEKSLNRLILDHVDVFYIHWPDPKHPIGPVMEYLENLKAQNRIGAIGVSNFSPEDITEALKYGKVDWYQGGYNLLYRSLEDSILPQIQNNGIHFEVYSPLAQGLLSGKYETEDPPSFEGHRNAMVHYKPENWPLVLDFLKKAQILAKEAGMTLLHLSLAWIRQRPFVNHILIGPRSPAQAEELLSPPILPPSEILEHLDALSLVLKAQIPFYPNIFNHIIN